MACGSGRLAASVTMNTVNKKGSVGVCVCGSHGRTLSRVHGRCVCADEVR